MNCSCRLMFRVMFWLVLGVFSILMLLISELCGLIVILCILFLLFS